jgi:SPP1 family predicted phage head-tail adaptor
MRIGPLRNQIAIQTYTTARDVHGGATPTWSTQATVWGSIEPLQGRELYNARQVSPDVTHKITIRFYSGLNPKNRLLNDSRIFNIKSITNLEERDRYMTVMCTESV